MTSRTRRLQDHDAAVAKGGARHLLVVVTGGTADTSTAGDWFPSHMFLPIINLDYVGNASGDDGAPATPASPAAATSDSWLASSSLHDATTRKLQKYPNYLRFA